MTITSRLVELYDQVKQPDHTVSLEDLVNLGEMRRGFYKQLNLSRTSQVQMFKQLLREAKSMQVHGHRGMCYCPLSMLRLSNGVLAPMARKKAEEEIRKTFSELKGTKVDNINEPLNALLPLESVADFHRTLNYMYAFVSAAHQLHVVKEDAPPPV